MSPARLISAILAAAFVLTLVPHVSVRAVEPGNDAFQRTWAHTDQPVAAGLANRTWMWGDGAFSVNMTEWYDEAYQGGSGYPSLRAVQYFDKSRMEITDPNADPNSPWFVTNGLLVTELISGRMQTGDDSFQVRYPAEVNVAGDAHDPHGPTYATFSGLRGTPARPVGTSLTQRVDRAGQVTDDPTLAEQVVVVGTVDEVTNHSIADVFWGFMVSSGTVYENDAYITAPLFENPYFATGRPITEPYWADVLVGGVSKLVLIQCFERRCLTYTPSNDPAWQVEAGNVGRHYYSWRYGWGLSIGSGGYELVTSFGDQSIPGSPRGVAYAPDGTIIVADQAAGQLLRFDLEGRLIQRIGEAGPGNAQFFSPLAVAIDGGGNVYATDEGSGRILKFADTGEFLQSWGSEGNASAGDYYHPAGIAVGPDGRIYVSDSTTSSIRIFDPQGSFLGQWNGIGEQESAHGHPQGIAIAPDGAVFVNISEIQSASNRVERYTSDGSYLGAWDIPIGASTSIAIDADGVVYIPNEFRAQVLRFASDGTELPAWQLPSPSESADSLELNGIAVDAAGRLYIADASSRRLIVLDGDGALAAEWSQQGLLRPSGVAANADGSYFVGDADTSAIVRFDASGAEVAEFGQPEINRITDLTLTSNGALLVLDDAFSEVHRFNQQGEHQTTISLLAPLSLPEHEFLPVALTADPATGEFFILTRGIYHPAHGRSSRVYHYAADGSLISSWIASRPRDKDPEPSGFGIDFVDGQLYVASDTAGLTVYAVDGTVSTQIPGYSADGIAAGAGDTLWLNRNVRTPTGEVEYHLQQIDLSNGAIVRDVIVEGVITGIATEPTSARVLITRAHDPGILIYGPSANDASGPRLAQVHALR